MAARAKKAATVHSPTARSRTRPVSHGNWNPDWESFAALDPAWTSKVIAMAMAPAASGALDAKTMELIGVALAASCSQLNAKLVRRHIRRAIGLGTTREELTAVLQLVSLEGLHTLCLGAPILLEELESVSGPAARFPLPSKGNP